MCAHDNVSTWMRIAISTNSRGAPSRFGLGPLQPECHRRCGRPQALPRGFDRKGPCRHGGVQIFRRGAELAVSVTAVRHRFPKSIAREFPAHRCLRCGPSRRSSKTYRHRRHSYRVDPAGKRALPRARWKSESQTSCEAKGQCCECNIAPPYYSLSLAVAVAAAVASASAFASASASSA